MDTEPSSSFGAQAPAKLTLQDRSFLFGLISGRGERFHRLDDGDKLSVPTLGIARGARH